MATEGILSSSQDLRGLPARSPTPAPTDADDDGGDGAYYPSYYDDDDDDDEASLEPVVFGSSALSSTRCQARRAELSTGRRWYRQLTWLSIDGTLI